MTLIVVKNKTVLDFPSLVRVALRSIYEHGTVSASEIRQMHESIIAWNQHITLRKEMSSDILKNENSDQEGEEICLEYVAGILKDNDDGKLEKRKEFFRQHNIDWRKFYRLPEAFSPKDFIRGQAILEQHKKDNPEDYA